jgi:D-beta-D-heptose 7-phosphate kinase/D-beta-D-heptose 1-phosphate adenosyltransferase
MLISVKEAQRITQKLKTLGKKVIFTNGCFDILHPGHIECLKKAKQLGDVLIVGLNSDNSIRKIKSKDRPIMDEKARISVLSAVKWVDYIVLFDEPTPEKVIKLIKPHIIVKGGDYSPEEVVGREVVENIVIIPYLRSYSTTQIIKKIQSLQKS